MCRIVRNLFGPGPAPAGIRCEERESQRERRESRSSTVPAPPVPDDYPLGPAKIVVANRRLIVVDHRFPGNGGAHPVVCGGSAHRSGRRRCQGRSAQLGAQHQTGLHRRLEGLHRSVPREPVSGRPLRPTSAITLSTWWSCRTLATARLRLAAIAAAHRLGKQEDPVSDPRSRPRFIVHGTGQSGARETHVFRCTASAALLIETGGDMSRNSEFYDIILDALTGEQ